MRKGGNRCSSGPSLGVAVIDLTAAIHVRCISKSSRNDIMATGEVMHIGLVPETSHIFSEEKNKSI